MSLSLQDLVKRLIAKVEISGNILPDRMAVARRVIEELAPFILVVVREEVKAELRQRAGKEKQQ
jgi:hypothetical protein